MTDAGYRAIGRNIYSISWIHDYIFYFEAISRNISILWINEYIFNTDAVGRNICFISWIHNYILNFESLAKLWAEAKIFSSKNGSYSAPIQ